MQITSEINNLDDENSNGMDKVKCMMRQGYIAICLSEIQYMMSLNAQSLLCVVTYPATSYSPQTIPH